jgi:hypothetical protein
VLRLGEVLGAWRVSIDLYTGNPSGTTANVGKRRNHLLPMREAAVAAIARDSDCEADAAAPE